VSQSSLPLSNAQRLLQLIPPSQLTWPTRLLRLAGAYLFVSIGITLMIRSELGVAPTDTLIKGFADTVGINFGIAFIAVSAVFFLFGWILGSPPGPGSLVGSLLIGNAIDLLLPLLDEGQPLTVRILLLLVGVAAVAIGICLAISTNLGAGPSEVVMLGLHRKGVPLIASRWIVDGVQMALGFLLGGPLGIGTAVFLLAMAPLIKVGLRWLRYSPPGDV
jgi:uncharacterized membrane protein YczE